MGEELSSIHQSLLLFFNTLKEMEVSNRREILFSAFFKIGSSLPSLNPVIISISLNSVKIRERSSSRVMRPRSTHCIAAIEVMSLVHEAKMKVVFRSIGSPAGFLGPIAFSYLNFPSLLPARSTTPGISRAAVAFSN